MEIALLGDRDSKCGSDWESKQAHMLKESTETTQTAVSSHPWLIISILSLPWLMLQMVCPVILGNLLSLGRRWREGQSLSKRRKRGGNSSPNQIAIRQ